MHLKSVCVVVIVSLPALFKPVAPQDSQQQKVPDQQNALADPGGNPALPLKTQEGGVMSFVPPPKLPKKRLFIFFESEFGSIPKIGVNPWIFQFWGYPRLRPRAKLAPLKPAAGSASDKMVMPFYLNSKQFQREEPGMSRTEFTRQFRLAARRNHQLDTCITSQLQCIPKTTQTTTLVSHTAIEGHKYNEPPDLPAPRTFLGGQLAHVAERPRRAASTRGGAS